MTNNKDCTTDIFGNVGVHTGDCPIDRVLCSDNISGTCKYFEGCNPAGTRCACSYEQQE